MKKTALIIAIFVYVSGTFAQKPIEIKPSETRHGPEKGSLVIIGGGEQPDEIWDKIIELAGGKDNARIVIVTNASPDTSQYVAKTIANVKAKVTTKNGVSSLSLNNIREANDENNLQSLREATGVFFVGGRQWKIADVYLNTLAHEEFRNVLDRGGVIAGTSAGASTQASFLWRGDTQSHKINIGDHTQGLGFLRNSVIDQHILARNRQLDVAAFIRIAPQFIGLGIDESTAVVIQRDRLEVIGKSYVAVHSADKENYSFLRKGDKYDLDKHEIHLSNEKDR